MLSFFSAAPKDSRSGFAAFGVAARRLLDREADDQREHQAGQADRNERNAPAFEALPVDHVCDPSPAPSFQQGVDILARNIIIDRACGETGAHATKRHAKRVD